MKKRKEIPKFKSQAEEERFWARHDATGYLDFSKAETAFFPKLKPSTRTISIRLPESLLESIRLLANKQDIPYQSMLKILLAEKVREDIKSDYAAALRTHTTRHAYHQTRTGTALTNRAVPA